MFELHVFCEPLDVRGFWSSRAGNAITRSNILENFKKRYFRTWFGIKVSGFIYFLILSWSHFIFSRVWLEWFAHDSGATSLRDYSQRKNTHKKTLWKYESFFLDFSRPRYNWGMSKKGMPLTDVKRHCDGSRDVFQLFSLEEASVKWVCNEPTSTINDYAELYHFHL